MDPKPALDPKLKETYDRIMGLSLKPQPSANPSQAPTEQPPPPPSPEAVINTVPPVQTAQVSNPAPKIQAQTLQKEEIPIPVKTDSTFVASDQEKKKSGVSPIAIILLIAVVLITYAFFWMNFFSISIPFLPS